MQHGVATTLTDNHFAFTLKNIVALTLKMVLYLPGKSSYSHINTNIFSISTIFATYCYLITIHLTDFVEPSLFILPFALKFFIW